MDLLLTHGYFLFEDPKEQAIMKPYVPLGILYLASHLKQRGIEVEIYDSTFGSHEELRKILETGPPSILGIYSNLMTRRNVLEIIATARAAGWTTVLGGPEPAAYAQEYLAAGAGVIVEGEGEVTLEELLGALQSEPRLAGSRVPEKLLRRINGIIFQAGDNSICRTPARSLIQDLDAQPWPDREQVDIEQYLNVWRRHHSMGS